MTDIDAIAVVAQQAGDQLAHGGGAVALTGDHLLIDLQYWASPEQFERYVAATANDGGQRRAVFAVALYVQDVEGGRYSSATPFEGATEELHIVAVDLDAGVDLLRCRITRDQGQPVLGDLEILLEDAGLAEGAPGWVLLRELATHV